MPATGMKISKFPPDSRLKWYLQNQILNWYHRMVDFPTALRLVKVFAHKARAADPGGG